MIANMDAWVRSDTLPPPSSYPKIADHILVPLSEYAFPRIPGVNLPQRCQSSVSPGLRPQLDHGILSIQPPRSGRLSCGLCPRSDATGTSAMASTCRRSPCACNLPAVREIFVIRRLVRPTNGLPLRHRISLPKTVVDRQKTGDPRESIAERYAGRERLLARYQSASMTWCISDGFCRRTAQPCFIGGEQEWTESVK